MSSRIPLGVNASCDTIPESIGKSNTWNYSELIAAGYYEQQLKTTVRSILGREGMLGNVGKASDE